MSLLCSEAVRYKAYAIYVTLDLCLPDTKTNKIKTTTTITTDNVDCNYDTVREGVKSWMKFVQSNATSASSSLASHHFLVKILGHTLILQRLLSSSRNSDGIITLMLIPISSLLRVSRSIPSFQK